ncbi:MAG TPA: hypothetical protein VNZ26_00860 [Vicinamibacterales bacterium]|jgi:hypothetical protein|nr:hypothetical protein [Vicinamibacterales bacterium]
MVKKALFAVLVAVFMVSSLAEAAPRKAVHHRSRRAVHAAASTSNSTIKKSTVRKVGKKSRHSKRTGRRIPSTKPQ